MSSSTSSHFLDQVFHERSIKLEESGCDLETKPFRQRYNKILRETTESTVAEYNRRTNAADYAVFWRKLSEEQKMKLLHDVYAIGDYGAGMIDGAESDEDISAIKCGTMGDLRLYLRTAVKRQKDRAMRGLPKEEYDFPRFWDDFNRRMDRLSKAAEKRALKEGGARQPAVE